MSFFTYLVQTKICKLVYRFDLSNWKLLHVAIYFLHCCHLQWNNYSKCLILNSCTFSVFPALEIKELLFMMLRYNIPYMVNSFFFSLYMPVMIKILYEMIKILHVKILNVIYLYWLHNDTLAEKTSLNGHSNEQWINGKRFVIPC